MKTIHCIALITLVGLLAWLPTLQNWFFKAYEATWLMTVTPHNFINLLRGHAFLYHLDLKIFGWNPWGWYLTAIILHILATILLFFFIKHISKNKIVAFLTSLFFIANTSYHDVLTWGSFNSYYPLLLFSMIAAMYSYFVFRQTGRRILFFMSLFFCIVCFFIRETGVAVVPLITILEVIFFNNLKIKTISLLRGKFEIWKIFKNVLPIFIRLLPFYSVLILFFITRAGYGGIAGDSADSLVKWRVKLVSDFLFLELFYAMILTSGKLLAPQLIPYPILNGLRDLISHIIPDAFTKIYFFPIVGLTFYCLLGFFVYKLRTRKKYFPIAVFFVIWILIFTAFVSLAVPNDNATLSSDYDWIPMRYRYFAFVGTTVLYAVFFLTIYEKYKNVIKNLYNYAIVLIILIVIFNIGMLWKLEADIYKKAFEPSKKFYTAFKKEFPSIPRNPTFYLYPHTSGLNDYMLEWYFIEGMSYFDGLYGVESQMEAVIEKIKNGKISLDKTYFLDYNAKKGLINNTQKTRELIKTEEISLNIKKVSDTSSIKFIASDFISPPIEIPYNLKLTINSSLLNNSFVGKKANNELFNALVDYNIARKEYMDNVKVTTSYTMSQREGEPFYHVVSENLVDGNYGFRSTWIADGKAQIILDLGRDEEIYGVIWGSIPQSIRIPSSYSFFISEDKKQWREVKKVKNNKNFSAIDMFEKVERGRFVKMAIRTTTQGEFAQLDEIEVINIKNKSIINFYKDRESLIEDNRNIFQFAGSSSDIVNAVNRGLKYYWARMDWETNRSIASDNNQFLYFWYPINFEKDITIKIPEAEVFAGVGQFLKKNITHFSFNFEEAPLIVNIGSSKLVPRYKMSK